MPHETPRHLKAPPPEAFDVDLFTGELRDTRTKEQKKAAFARQFVQPLMFRTSEIAQMGVNPHPLLPITDKTRLGLAMFDPRTDEEKERDLEREAQRLTLALPFAQAVDDPIATTPQREYESQFATEHLPTSLHVPPEQGSNGNVSYIPIALVYNPDLATLFGHLS
jgi:hypothetical protein